MIWLQKFKMFIIIRLVNRLNINRYLPVVSETPKMADNSSKNANAFARKDNLSPQGLLVPGQTRAMSNRKNEDQSARDLGSRRGSRPENSRRGVSNRVVPMSGEIEYSRSSKRRHAEKPAALDLEYAQQKLTMNPYQRLKTYQRKYAKLDKKKKINEMDDYFDKLRDQFPQLIESQGDDINRLQYHCMNDAKEKPDGDISSEDCVENATVFQFLLFKQRMRHMEAMWRKAFVKAKAAGQFIKFIRDIQDKIYLLGISYNIKDTKETLQIPCMIIPPDSRFSQIWSLTIAVLLIYTATYMPFKTCFVDESTNTDEIIDWTVDILFMVDILVNFLQATEYSDGTWEVRPKQLARNYIKSWFAFDLVSVIPFNLIEKFFDKSEQGGSESQSYNQLIRLARLPRLYRMTKLMRLFKVIKSAKKIKWVQKLLKSVKVNSAIQRMIQGMITAVLLTHIFACFWYLTAKFHNFSDMTWVARMGLRGQPAGVHYVWALHWATQTITTVGYGDIPAFTNTEIIFSFIWMLVGVAFYSFIIGNFSSILTGSSQVQKSIQYRVQGLSELARKAQIPFDTSKQIKQYIESNVMAFITQDEDQQLIQMLPPCLRDEILLITYGEMIDRIDFLQSVEDHEFMWKLLQSFVDIRFNKGDVLYWRGDDSDAMYFILTGKVKLYTDGNPFIKYQNGDCFGDQDMLLNLPRDSKAVAITHLHLKALNGEMFEQISQHAQETCLKMIVNARAKRDKHFYLIRKLNERLSRKNIVIEEGASISQLKVAEMSSKELPSNVSQKSNQPGMFASSIGKASSQRSLLLSPDNKLQINSMLPGPVPKLLRNKSEQNNTYVKPNQVMNFKMHPMAVIQENETGSKSSRSRHNSAQSRNKGDSVLPVEFAGIAEASNLTPKRSMTPSGNTFSSMVGSLNKSRPTVKPKHRMSILGSTTINGRKIISRKHIMMDARLKKLSNMNDNRKSETEIQSMSMGLMDKFWKQNVPMITEIEMEHQSRQKYSKNGTSEAISERHEDEYESMSDQRAQIEVQIQDQQTENYVTPQKKDHTDESESPGVKDSTTAKDKKLSLVDEKNMVSFKQSSGFEDLQIQTKQRSNRDQDVVFNQQTLIAQKQSSTGQQAILSSPSSNMSPSFGSRFFQQENSGRTPKSGSTLSVLSRKNSFINSVPTRVSLNSSQLNNALQVSSRVKLATQQRQIQQLSMRVRKQGMDQLGNKHSYFSENGEDADNSEISMTFGKESEELDSKIEALKKLELDEIHEDEDEDEDDEAAENRRRTLLDKVVGDVFGKNKQNLYEMFPSLAVITVPKMPIITPKGDEIILRKKYNNNMNLLNEAFEQKKELFDSEQMIANEEQQMQMQQMHKSQKHHSRQQNGHEVHSSSKTPTIESQTPVNVRRSQLGSEMSPHASSPSPANWHHRTKNKDRKESGDASDQSQTVKKPPLMHPHHSRTKSSDRADGSNIRPPTGKKLLNTQQNLEPPKSMAITVAIEELGDGQENIIKRTKSYMTEKKQTTSSDQESARPSMRMKGSTEYLDVRNLQSSARSKSSTPSDMPKDTGVIDASFHQLNGKLKSKNDLRREFISAPVMERLKKASRQMSTERPKKLETAAPGPLDKQTSLELSSPETATKKVHQDVTISIMNLNNSSRVIQEESKEVKAAPAGQATSGLVSMEDGDMSEVLSSNADVQPTSQTQNSSVESPQKQNDLDMEKRFEILKLLKDFIDKDEGNHQNSPQSKDVLKLFSKNAEQDLGSGRRPSGSRIEYIGNESMKSVVRFNLDSYLLGLNTFEVISMFDHVQQAMTGMKKKLVKINQHIDSIEKRQAKLDTNADKMIEKMQAYRELKKEVANLNRTQERVKRQNSKEPRNMKARRGQGKMQGQSSASPNLNNTTSNKNLHKQDSQTEGLQLSVVGNDFPETSSLPVQQPAESSLALAQHEVQTHQTFPFGSPSKLQQQQMSAKQNGLAVHKRDNLLQVASVEEMSAETIAKIVNRPPTNM